MILRKLCKIACVTLATSLLLSSCMGSDKDYTQYVDPFIGAAATGHTFPGAARPFGMIQASPETGAVGWKYCSGYCFDDSLIWGFSQNHLNGTGCMDLGDILLQPITGTRQRTDYRSRFDRKSEAASPGYYTVMLTDPGVKAEITSTTRTSFYRFTYEKADSASLLVDMQHGLTWNENSYQNHVLSCTFNQEDDYTFSGESRRSVWVNRKLYYVIQFNKPIVSKQVLSAKEGEKGPRTVLSFDIAPGEELLVKVSISTTGVEGAKNNLAAENSEWDFDRTRVEARREWNSYLSRVDVKGTPEQLKNYYTSFYHLLLQPNTISDVDGTYVGVGDSISTINGGTCYSTFSLWDTYRAAHPLYTIVTPERVDGFVNSMIAQSKEQGFLPIWALWGKENYCMVANHGVPVVVDAYLKGFTGFDVDEAYNAVLNSLTVSHRNSDWEVYDKYGFYPSNIITAESVSKTLESCFDDYAASLMAIQLGKTQDAELFKRRSEYYKNLFDSTTQFMRPRYSDSSWRSPFNPSALAHAESIGGDYTEGNAWQYTWHVQHDPQGLVGLFPSREQFFTKLDSLFTIDASLMGGGLSDVTGLIGQYAHGNEPSHHVSYLYALAGRPERTQELIREIFDTQYKSKPDGLCGNDDCGQMSAWYMFSAMGFYPFNPVNGQYVFGAPQMEQIELKLPNNKTFKVIAEGLTAENKYVEFVMLDSKVLDRNYITHEEVMKGGTLRFMMSSKPAPQRLR